MGRAVEHGGWEASCNADERAWLGEGARVIGSIRNPWLRRAALVVAFPIAFVLDILIAVVASVRETCSDAADCWRGPTR